ncbi:DUF4345 domain-containing protein [Nocardia amikacinitolerans]|uniref:DUF4345 domain-containing protein n=1 Tax=Nocardia amikacinitolerans TaxID=756689 RepID=UPI0020A38544|nr:DUF4345 domain-containing protein [Nocardia amikacinitolerans]MCP2287611.1 protein of unknown function (DUF4345) [Nocardia amikacinitolerans]
MAKLLKILAMTMGVACVAIGFLHMALGIDSVPDMGSSGVTADSQSRFFGAIFVGYGVAWIWTARRTPIPAVAVRWLAGIFLLGAVGRVLSVAVYGWPHWFQIVLTVIEFVFPPVYFWLADSDEQRVAGERVAVS